MPKPTPLQQSTACMDQHVFTLGKYSPELYKLLRNYITIFDEYPVENTHSILRAQTKSSDSADQLRKKAKTIFQSKEKQCNFRSFFTAPKQFSFSHNQLQFLKVKCAQLLSSIFKQLSQTPGQSSFSSEGRSRYVTLPTVCSDKPMKTNVLPLGFHCVIKQIQQRPATYQNVKSLNLTRNGFFSMVASTHFIMFVLRKAHLALYVDIFCNRK